MIDNSALSTKLALRRMLLRRYHATTPPRVLDCCAGDGVIWNALRRDIPVASYVPVDLKGGAGRLQADSRRILAGNAWAADVVDIDTYGSPWEHWLALLGCARPAVTVFLTHGRGGGHSAYGYAVAAWIARPPAGDLVVYYGLRLTLA